MFVTDAGQPALALIALIAVPTGVKIFNLADHGRVDQVYRPDADGDRSSWCSSIGGTGVFLASPLIDFAVNDIYYVVAHFHYVMVGGLLFGTTPGCTTVPRHQ